MAPKPALAKKLSQILFPRFRMRVIFQLFFPAALNFLKLKTESFYLIV